MRSKHSEVYLKEGVNLDKVLLGLQRKAVDRIILGPGTFFTQGAWAMDPTTHYQSVAGNVQIIGQGKDRTTIMLRDPIVHTDNKRRPDVPILRIGNLHQTAYGGGISGVTIDGDWRRNIGNCFVTVGARAFGSKMQFEDVRVRGVFGTYDSLPVQEGSVIKLQFEAFGISTMHVANLGGIKEDPDAPDDGGHVGKDCIVEDCPEYSYLSPFSFGTTKMPDARTWDCRRSQWINCFADVEPGNHAAFTLYHKTHVIGGGSSGCQYAFYNDTDSVTDCLVEGGWHVIGYSAATFVHGGGYLPMKENVVIRGTVFEFEKWKKSNGVAIGLALLRDPKKRNPESGFKTIVMEGCRFQSGPEFTLFPFSTDAVSIKNVAIRNCVEEAILKAAPHFVGPVNGELEYVSNLGKREAFSTKTNL